MLIIDAHLDVAYNALKYNRNPLLTLAQIRAHDVVSDKRGTATVSFPALRNAGVGLIFATLFASSRESALFYGSDVHLTYTNPDEAHALGMAQLDYYRRLVDDETHALRLVTDQAVLDEVLASQEEERPLLGLVPLMEGADPIRTPEELELWYAKGVRLIGPAWDDTRYAAGAWRNSSHGLTKQGHALLEVMGEFSLPLDLTHMNTKGALEALDSYPGPVVATHSNARALVPGERQLDDAQIQRIGEREGVIGVVLFNRFLRAGHTKSDLRELVTLDHVVAHIDHICQLLGSANHVGVGSDFDGGFGAEAIPAEMDSIADLPLIAAHLSDYGYAESDVAKIMGGNWLRMLRGALPA